jgi:hypothetical protein
LEGLKKKNITEVDNPRLEWYLEDLYRYNFDIKWMPGKDNTISNALSRQPHFGHPECEADAIPVDFCRRLAGEEKEAREDPLLRDMFEKAKEEE